MYTSLREFYSSSEWHAFRKVVIAERIARDGAVIDDYTGDTILNDYDVVLHHKTHLTPQNVNDPAIAFGEGNIMVVTHRSHNIIHARFGHGRSKCFLVWGAPKSGKTRWVDETMLIGMDMVVELDRIYRGIGAGGINGRYNQVAFAVRDVLIDSIRMRRGSWRDAYIVGTFPLEAERKRLMGMLGAEEVHIDTDMDTCLSRCVTHDEREMVRKWFRMQGVQ